MAILKNHQYRSFNLDTWGDKRRVVVGHNRYLEPEIIYETPAGERTLFKHIGADKPSGNERVGIHSLNFILHRTTVASLTYNEEKDEFELVISAGGYYTTTTRNAIKDALEFFQLRGGASFAKGKFTVMVSGSKGPIFGGEYCDKHDEYKYRLKPSDFIASMT